MMTCEECDLIIERKMQSFRPCFIAKLRGRRHEIFLGMDGQLWRMITLEECAMGIQPSGHSFGQVTVASGPEQTFAFCKDFGLPSPERDSFLEALAWRHPNHGFWMQLCLERLEHGRYL